MSLREKIAAAIEGYDVAAADFYNQYINEEESFELADKVIAAILQEADADVENDPPLFMAVFGCGFETNDYDVALIHAFKCEECGNDD